MQSLFSLSRPDTAPKSIRGLVADRCHGCSLVEPFVKPFEEFRVPLETISRIQHPMILFGEYDQTSRNAHAEIGVIRPNSFRYRQAIVLFPVEDQHGSGPLLYEICRIVLLDQFGAFPRWPAKLVIEEEQFVRCEAVTPRVEDTVVAS